jgi:hypothetical protein
MRIPFIGGTSNQRCELKGDIKSVSDDIKSEVEIRREDVISLHQKIDANKKRK